MKGILGHIIGDSGQEYPFLPKFQKTSGLQEEIYELGVNDGFRWYREGGNGPKPSDVRRKIGETFDIGYVDGDMEQAYWNGFWEGTYLAVLPNRQRPGQQLSRRGNRLAGRVLTPAEKDALVNEEGKAANIDDLDLEGTHYVDSTNDDAVALFL